MRTVLLFAVLSVAMSACQPVTPDPSVPTVLPSPAVTLARATAPSPTTTIKPARKILPTATPKPFDEFAWALAAVEADLNVLADAGFEAEAEAEPRAFL